nr:megakaryocyte and platelet inhibitory receptor G6b isoform X2 [Rattus norvegicus]
MQRPVQRAPPDPVGLFERDPNCAPALLWPPAFPRHWYQAARAATERRGFWYFFLQRTPREREPHSDSSVRGQGRLPAFGIYPRIRVFQSLDPVAGLWACAGTGSLGLGLVAAQTAVCTVLIGAACGRGTSKTRLVTLQGLPYRRSPPPPPPPPPPPGPLPTIAPVINAEPQRPLEQDSKISGHLDQEPNLHYADLDHSVLRRHRRMSALVPGDASTVYAVVV